MKRDRVISLILCLATSSICFLPIALSNQGIQAETDDEVNFSRLREQMVSTQIEARGIKDKGVLTAMRKVKRHEFVPAAYKSLAYEDTPLPIPEGQTISQPYVVALMTELLSLNGTQKVLEIGTGSGYQAAILAELAAQVYTIEIIPALAERSEELLKSLGYTNITVKCGDGYIGWKEHAPFDGIIVTCAADEIPQGLVEQLSEGGRMVIPVGSIYQELKLIEKSGSQAKVKDIIAVRFVPMHH
jgi:protein-L-isoaspartate(D-aspartate) O-methyltransferase